MKQSVPKLFVSLSWWFVSPSFRNNPRRELFLFVLRQVPGAREHLSAARPRQAQDRHGRLLNSLHGSGSTILMPGF